MTTKEFIDKKVEEFRKEWAYLCIGTTSESEFEDMIADVRQSLKDVFKFAFNLVADKENKGV